MLHAVPVPESSQWLRFADLSDIILLRIYLTSSAHLAVETGRRPVGGWPHPGLAGTSSTLQHTPITSHSTEHSFTHRYTFQFTSTGYFLYLHFEYIWLKYCYDYAISVYNSVMCHCYPWWAEAWTRTVQGEAAASGWAAWTTSSADLQYNTLIIIKMSVWKELLQWIHLIFLATNTSLKVGSSLLYKLPNSIHWKLVPGFL